MKNTKYILLLALLSLYLWTCQKDSTTECPPGLPCTTQTGANTFGCYINGVPWKADIAPYVLDPTLHEIEAEYDESNYGQDYFNDLRILAISVDSMAFTFLSVSFNPVTTTGQLTHNELNSIRFEAWLKSPQNVTTVYHIDTLAPYHFSITNLDFDKNIAAGKFSLTAVSENKNDTILVTEGRFDVKYNPF